MTTMITRDESSPSCTISRRRFFLRHCVITDQSFSVGNIALNYMDESSSTEQYLHFSRIAPNRHENRWWSICDHATVTILQEREVALWDKYTYWLENIKKMIMLTVIEANLKAKKYVVTRIIIQEYEETTNIKIWQMRTKKKKESIPEVWYTTTKLTKWTAAKQRHKSNSNSSHV